MENRSGKPKGVVKGAPSGFVISLLDAVYAILPAIVAEYRARGRELRFVDHFAALNNNDSSNMRTDNLHPNATGNHVIAREWFKVLTTPGKDVSKP